MSKRRFREPHQPKEPRGPKLPVRLARERMQRARAANHHTQEELAEGADLSLDTIRRAEAGRPVSLDAAEAIASRFNMTVEDLIAPKAPAQMSPEVLPARIEVRIAEAKLLPRRDLQIALWGNPLSDTSPPYPVMPWWQIAAEITAVAARVPNLATELTALQEIVHPYHPTFDDPDWARAGYGLRTVCLVGHVTLRNPSPEPVAIRLEPRHEASVTDSRWVELAAAHAPLDTHQWLQCVTSALLVSCEPKGGATFTCTLPPNGGRAEVEISISFTLSSRLTSDLAVNDDTFESDGTLEWAQARYLVAFTSGAALITYIEGGTLTAPIKLYADGRAEERILELRVDAAGSIEKILKQDRDHRLNRIDDPADLLRRWLALRHDAYPHWVEELRELVRQQTERFSPSN
jgi:DNA-binding XRE family transcriptional regulator